MPTSKTLKPETLPLFEQRPLSSWILWALVTCFGCIIFFSDGIAALFAAWAQPEYSHGPIIPIISVFLLLRELRDHPANEESVNSVPGFMFALFGMFVGLVGNLTQIPYLIAYGLIIVIGGLILLNCGVSRGLRCWPAWIYLLFMLPLPNFMYWQLSTYLQFISSEIGVEFIRIVGVPVYLDGNIIDLGIYKLQVAEACNGLRYLFPLMSFGFLFAVLYQGPFIHKLILFVSTMPITVLMNSARIGAIGLLVDRFGIEHAEGFLHAFEGWIIFVACIAALYLEAFLLQRLTKHPRPVLDILDLSVSGLFKPVSLAKDASANRSMVLFGLIALFAGVVWQTAPARASTQLQRETLGAFPSKLGQWSGRRATLDSEIEAVLGADEYLLANFSSPTSEIGVNLFISYYNSTTDGSGIHSPEICIPGGGWEVSRWGQVQVEINNESNPPVAFKLNRATIQKGANRQLVYYWFEQRGRRLASEYVTKLYTVLDSFTKGRADGALVRVVTPIGPKESVLKADRRLQEFLKPVIKKLPVFIPN